MWNIIMHDGNNGACGRPVFFNPTFLIKRRERTPKKKINKIGPEQLMN
jgi:hypothetical protein